MGVRDEELVQRLIAMPAPFTLQVVVTECRSQEATSSTASALRAPPSTHAVSSYSKEKKLAHEAKSETRPSTSQPRASRASCGKQHGQQTCPAADTVWCGCSNKSHWSHTDRWPRVAPSVLSVTVTGISTNFAATAIPRHSSIDVRSKEVSRATDSILCEATFPQLDATPYATRESHQACRLEDAPQVHAFPDNSRHGYPPVCVRLYRSDP